MEDRTRATQANGERTPFDGIAEAVRDTFVAGYVAADKAWRKRLELARLATREGEPHVERSAENAYAEWDGRWHDRDE